MDDVRPAIDVRLFLLESPAVSGALNRLLEMPYDADASEPLRTLREHYAAYIRAAEVTAKGDSKTVLASESPSARLTARESHAPSVSCTRRYRLDGVLGHCLVFLLITGVLIGLVALAKSSISFNELEADLHESAAAAYAVAHVGDNSSAHCSCPACH